MSDELMLGGQKTGETGEQEQNVAKSSVIAESVIGTGHESKRYRDARITWKYFQEAFETVARWVRARDSAFWTAWATIVMAITTGIYTYYAGRQWHEMRRQLDDSEVAQSAEIEIEDFSGAPISGGYSRITFTIANVGQTKAENINLVEDNSIWLLPNNLLSADQARRIAATIKPVPSRDSGFSLGAGKSRKFDTEGARIDALVKEKADHSFTVLVGYKDVFGKEKWTGDCLVFVYMARKYLPCPFGHPHS